LCTYQYIEKQNTTSKRRNALKCISSTPAV
jgi:hypothetical protein